MKGRETTRVHLVDGSGYIFRAYFGLRPLTRSDGLHTHAVIGFANMLGKLLREQQPTHLGIAFDTAGPTFRHQAFAGYKAHREVPPDDLQPQIPLVLALVRALNIPIWEVSGFEADDVLGTLARQATEQGHRTVLVSADKDLLQLVTSQVTMYDPMREQHFDVAAVRERLGVDPSGVADVLALAGDTSDNIPGVPRVGMKTAAKWVAAHGDVEQVIAAIARVAKPKAAEASLVAHQEVARLSKRLTTVDVQAPVQLDVDALRVRALDAEALRALLTEIEAFGLMRHFKLGPGGEGADAGGGASAAAAADPASAPASAPVAPEAAAAPAAAEPSPPAPGGAAGGDGPIDRASYRTISTLAELDRVIAGCRRAGMVSVDLETTSLRPWQAEIVGWALAAPGQAPAYVPVAHHYLGVPRQLDPAKVAERLAPLLADPNVGKVGQNIKYDLVVLARSGLRVDGVAHDTMVAAWLLDPGRASLSLDTLAREFLGHQTIRYDDVTGKGRSRRPFCEVPIDEATAYAAEDADVALRLSSLLVDRLDEAALGRVYRDIEMPLIPILADMEVVGVGLDGAHLGRVSRRLGERIDAIEAEIFALIGTRINLGSPKQVAELLFTTLALRPPSTAGSRRRTSGGAFSTDRRALKQLQAQHPVARLLLAHRRLAKLRNTYADTLPALAAADGDRLHTQFNQTRAETGRLSSSDPNLQNIPIRSPDGSDDGRQIRAAFVAPTGWRLVCADYSQIELRLIAHLSMDPAFLAAFAEGEDIHRTTGEALFSGSSLGSDERRARAKEVNFGIPYGLTAFGLKDRLLHGAAEIDITMGEAEAYISRYFARYPRVRALLDSTIEEATERGYVTTMSGRRRYLPDLRHQAKLRRDAARREAMNTPIQGSAADLIKLAMLRVAEALRRERRRARLILQVHDELVVETPADEVAGVRALLAREMAAVAALRVPLVVDVGDGANWSAAH